MSKGKINYRKANRELLKVKEYIDSVLDPVLSDSRDLKLYDAFYQAEDIINEYPLVKDEYEVYDLFYWFCNDYYNYSFMEWIEENNINKNLMEYIGHTSSFYISRYHNIENIADLFYTINNGYGEVQFSGNKIIPFVDVNISYNDSLDDDVYDLDYIISGKFLKDIKSYFDDALKLASYIDDFKSNQVQYFKDYVENKNDEIIYMMDQDQKAAEKEKEDFIINSACLILA